MPEHDRPLAPSPRMLHSEQLTKLAEAADQAIERYYSDREHQSSDRLTDYDIWQSAEEAAARLKAYADRLYEVAK